MLELARRVPLDLVFRKPGWPAFCLAAWLAACLSPCPAYGWGREGNRIVALIAIRQLAPEAQRNIQALLAGDERQDLAAASTWADDILARRPETEPWHFVNIPDAEAAYRAGRDCPGDACAVAQVARWRAVLADAQAPPGRRAEALKFLVSLVADLHQPLHTACRPLPHRSRYPKPAVPCGADPHGDRDADELMVRFGDLGVSLHHVWDHELFYGETGTLSAVADRLAAEVTPAQRREWASGTVEDWVNQTHALARQVAYGMLPKGQPLQRQGIVISLRYEAEARNTVELQMKRAGVRLAALLNDALAGAATVQGSGFSAQGEPHTGP
ncbi:MAG: S1/P1 nuclease [SAR324 cluster bacterium]